VAEEVAVSVLLIVIVGWVVLAVFVCSLGRAAKAGDEQELERMRVWAEQGGRRAAVAPATRMAAPVAHRDETLVASLSVVAER
jgi:hypothetical protein